MLHQGGIHRGGQDLLRADDRDRQGMAAAPQLHHGAVHNLLHYLIGAVQAYLFPGHTGDREHIFGDAGQPPGLLTDLLQQGTALRFAQVGLLQQQAVGTLNGGERCAQIVGKRPQKIRPKLFAFDLIPQAFGLLYPSGKGADDHRDHQHDHEGERVTRDAHIKAPKGVGEHVIDAEHPDDRGQNTPHIAVGDQCHYGDSQHKDENGKGVVVIVHAGKHAAYGHRCPQ